jgi:hypothetical protein
MRNNLRTVTGMCAREEVNLILLKEQPCMHVDVYFQWSGSVGDPWKFRDLVAALRRWASEDRTWI